MRNWQCPACDTYNPETVDECLNCGVDRTGKPAAVDGRPDSEVAVCPGCQGRNPVNRPVCQWCGNRLPHVPAVDAKTDPPAGIPRWPGLQPATGDREQVFVPSPFGVNARTDPGVDEIIPDLLTPVPRTRPCAACGVMLDTDEGIVVAGPRLLCRACFHEEFSSKGRDPSSGSSPIAGGDGEAHTEPSPEARTRRKTGAVLLVAGILIAGAGAAVTWLYTLTWGFTPLALGALLSVVGLARLAGSS